MTNSPALRIDTLEQDDMAAVRKLLTYRSSNAFDNIDRVYYHDKFEYILKHKTGRSPLFALCAYMGDELVGLILVEEQMDSLTYFEVVCLAVDVHHRHAGIGKALMAAAEAKMRNLGAKHSFLKVFHVKQNAGVEKFYRALGYANEDILPDYYEVGSAKHHHYADCGVLYKKL